MFMYTVLYNNRNNSIHLSNGTSVYSRVVYSVRIIEIFRIPLAILCVLIFFISLNTSATSPSVGATTLNSNYVSSVNPADVSYIDAINNLRGSVGQQPLSYDSRLENSAYDKARNMVASDYWGHYSPFGESFSDFIWRRSPTSKRVGENLAKCYTSRVQAFDALVASPTHYQIMVGDFTNVGISEQVSPKDNCTYTVLHFAKN